MIDKFAFPLGEDKPQVLVVDDDPDINRLLQVRLRNVGFQVRSAPDGETALEEIRRLAPDLVLLDISLPGISGLDVLEHIRTERLDIAVVMTTAFGSESVAVDALRRGADDYLRKPFEPVELRAVVDRTMSRLNLRRQNEQLRERLDAELVHASEIQQRLLPQHNPTIQGYDIASRCVPAHVVGGDFYDWRELDNGGLAFTLGDVIGKGLPAAILMATVRACLRPAIRMHDPATATNLVAQALDEDLSRTRSFVTMFVGKLDAERHVVSFVDAGHGRALVIRANRSFELLQGTDVPVGIFPDTNYQSHDVELASGDTMCLYSDGLQDSLGGNHIQNLVSCISQAASAGEAVASLIDLARDSGGWTDDVTIIVLRRDKEN